MVMFFASPPKGRKGAALPKHGNQHQGDEKVPRFGPPRVSSFKVPPPPKQLSMSSTKKFMGLLPARKTSTKSNKPEASGAAAAQGPSFGNVGIVNRAINLANNVLMPQEEDMSLTARQERHRAKMEAQRRKWDGLDASDMQLKPRDNHNDILNPRSPLYKGNLRVTYLRHLKRRFEDEANGDKVWSVELLSSWFEKDLRWQYLHAQEHTQMGDVNYGNWLKAAIRLHYHMMRDSNIPRLAGGDHTRTRKYLAPKQKLSQAELDEEWRNVADFLKGGQFMPAGRVTLKEAISNERREVFEYEWNELVKNKRWNEQTHEKPMWLFPKLHEKEVKLDLKRKGWL